MIPFKKTNRGGLIRMAIFIGIVLILLAYFGLNLRGIVASETFQDNWQFVSGLAVDIWTKYLSVVAKFFWDRVITPLLIK